MISRLLIGFLCTPLLSPVRAEIDYCRSRDYRDLPATRVPFISITAHHTRPTGSLVVWVGFYSNCLTSSDRMVLSVVFHWRLSNSKSPQVFPTILNILADFNTVVVCIVTILPIVYWPTTRPGCQNRKCTYVNNRCIRSRNNKDIIALTVDRLNECKIVTPTRRMWTLNYYITRCRQKVS